MSLRFRQQGSNETGAPRWRPGERVRTILNHFHRIQPLPGWAIALLTIVGLLALAGLIVAIVAMHYPDIPSTIVVNETCPIDAECIPNNITVDFLTVNNHTQLNELIRVDGDFICATPVWPSCLDISAQGCQPGHPLQQSCIPQNLSVDSLTCIGGGSSCLPITLTDISGQNCTTPLSPSCIDISGETCSIPVQLSCIDISNHGPCAGGPVHSSCLDISSQSCPGGPLSPGCVPPNLILDSLYVTNLTAITTNILNVTIVDTVLNSDLYVENLFLNGSMTCTGGALISPSCLNITNNDDISGFACTTPLQPSCIQIDGQVCLSTPISPSCVDISGETCPGGPVNQNCIEISNMACPGGDLDKTCVPLASVNGVTGDPTMRDLDLVSLDGSLGIAPLPLLNQINLQLASLSNATSCATPLANDCLPLVAINGVSGAPITKEIQLLAGSGVSILSLPGSNSITVSTLPLSNTTTCTTPLGDDCFPPRIRTINGIAPDALLDFDVIGSCSVVVTPTTNGITLSSPPDVLSGLTVCSSSIPDSCVNISSKTCSSPLDDSCVPPRIRSINGIFPDGTLDFDVLGSSSVVVTPGLNGITLTSPPDTLSGSTVCSSPIPNSCLPPNVTFNTVTANEFIGLNMTIMSIINMQTSYDTLAINQLTVNYTTLTGPLTCSGNGSISSSCIDFPFLSVEGVSANPSTKNVDFVPGSGIQITGNPLSNSVTFAVAPLNSSYTTCSTLLPTTCLPLVSINGVSGDPAFKDLTLVAGTNIAITPSIGTNSITIGMAPTCSSVLNDTCIPPRIKTINGISPDGSLDFDILGSSSVVVTPATNGITLSSPPDILGSDTVCSSVLNDTCIPTRIKSINGILPDLGLDFDILGSSSVTVTPAPNGVTLTASLSSSTNCTSPIPQTCYDISAKSCTIPVNANCVDISGEACTAPIADSCTPTRIKTINGILPTGALDFGIVAGTGISVTAGTNQITIASTAQESTSMFDDMISPDIAYAEDGPTIFHTATNNWNVSGVREAQVQPDSIDVNPTHKCIGVAKMSVETRNDPNVWITLFHATGAYLFGFAAFQAEFRVRMSHTPGAGTGDYNVRLGYMDVLTVAPVDGALPVDGVYFKIDGDQGGNWLFETASNSVRTQVNTGVAVSIAAYQKLSISVNAAGTLATGTIDGVLVASVATNIPVAAGRQSGFGMTILREPATTTNNQMFIDYVSQAYQYTAPR